MAHLIRTWNVFHGNASPPRRRSYLRAALTLAIEEEPAVVCLQELPVWALSRLGSWTGYHAFGAVARRGAPPAEVAGWITRQWQGVLRSAIAGQANAVLVRPDLHARAVGTVQVSEGRRERRVVQLVRVAGVGLVANTHLTQRDPEAAAAELRRARTFLEGHARPGEPTLLAGDLNLPAPTVAGYSATAPGLDQVLVRGVACSPPVVWPTGRRMHNGLVLSDHAPVEVCLR